MESAAAHAPSGHSASPGRWPFGRIRVGRCSAGRPVAFGLYGCARSPVSALRSESAARRGDRDAPLRNLIVRKTKRASMTPCRPSTIESRASGSGASCLAGSGGAPRRSPRGRLARLVAFPEPCEVRPSRWRPLYVRSAAAQPLRLGPLRIRAGPALDGSRRRSAHVRKLIQEVAPVVFRGYRRRGAPRGRGPFLSNACLRAVRGLVPPFGISARAAGVTLWAIRTHVPIRGRGSRGDSAPRGGCGGGP